MRIVIGKLWCGALIAGILLLSSCRPPAYRLEKVEGRVIAVDSVWDKNLDERYISVLEPYKTKIDSEMNRVIGVCNETMAGGRPESLLSNLVADVLRQAATQVQEQPADVGLVNMGGLRSVLSAGKITCGDVYEILPFENSLCVLTLKGADLNVLFEQIATAKGEGISGARLNITKDGKLLSATVNNQPVDDEKLYTVATIDYLADGNDGVPALLKAQKRVCPEKATLRGLFMTYIEKQTAAGKKITGRIEGRMTVEP